MKVHMVERKADGALLLTALIWGSGFVAVDYSLQCGFPSSLLNLLRFALGALIFLLILNRNVRLIPKTTWKKGLIAGALFFVSFYTQTLGMVYTLTSNSAFITATNVIMVPFIMWLVLKRRPDPKTFVASALCLFGVLVLTSGEGFSLQFNFGDFLTLLCAFTYALHICYLNVAASDTKAVHLTFVQMLVVAVIALIVFVLFELEGLGAVQWGKGLLPVLYLGIFPTSLCLFLQIYGQQLTSAPKAAILLSLECVFGSLLTVLFGFRTAYDDNCCRRFDCVFLGLDYGMAAENGTIALSAMALLLMETVRKIGKVRKWQTKNLRRNYSSFSKNRCASRPVILRPN